VRKNKDIYYWINYVNTIICTLISYSIYCDMSTLCWMTQRSC
jgi:hypothetical protein